MPDPFTSQQGGTSQMSRRVFLGSHLAQLGQSNWPSLSLGSLDVVPSGETQSSSPWLLMVKDATTTSKNAAVLLAQKIIFFE